MRLVATEDMSTRQLMAIRARSYGRATCGCPAGCCGNDALSEEQIRFNEEQAATLRHVKRLLSTREHIPNKKEAKAKRRYAAGVRR